MVLPFYQLAKIFIFKAPPVPPSQPQPQRQPQVQQSSGIGSYFRSFFNTQENSIGASAAEETPELPQSNPSQVTGPQPQPPLGPPRIKPSGFVPQDDDVYVK